MPCTTSTSNTLHRLRLSAKESHALFASHSYQKKRHVHPSTSLRRNKKHREIKKEKHCRFLIQSSKALPMSAVRQEAYPGGQGSQCCFHESTNRLAVKALPPCSSGKTDGRPPGSHFNNCSPPGVCHLLLFLLKGRRDGKRNESEK